MNTEKLTIECESIECIEPTLGGQHSPHLKVTLDDVHIDALLLQLANKLDVETVLDYFPDSLIKDYINLAKVLVNESDEGVDDVV